MHQENSKVTYIKQIRSNVFVLRFYSPIISSKSLPGQFLNIKVDESNDPLLRRAYSLHNIYDNDVEIIFNVVGKGSKILSNKKIGDSIDVIGLLGVPFNTSSTFETGILVSGGLGIAPMPITAKSIIANEKKIVNIHGARTEDMLINDGRLLNPVYCTDDGSIGIKGNVVFTLNKYLNENDLGVVKVFSCGPNRMIMALGNYCLLNNIEIEVSLECQMACGIGICQGCPVEMTKGEKRYSLVCTQGPNYNFKDINMESLLTGAH
ncbi:MAG: dihydroorotate dehydrogenase electron transfer subunit [Chlorobiota bacterium]|jgi:dihydroorotate dehydrogenase electron transfer subunit|nr:dihydroorotate dehydrogenase electron transfer subunit [Chlorobiota bacterium]QQS66717.1 MAG: dihydroorotate dehydrogenase electron transfer subunit [Chlorobiota bacterium]